MPEQQTKEQDMVRAMVPDIKKLVPNLLVAGVMPVIAYAIIHPHLRSNTEALLMIMVFPLGEIIYERIRAKRFEPIGIIVLVGIAFGLVGALVTHATLVLKIRTSAFTGVAALCCLGSLFARRPAMYFLGRSFATAGDPKRKELFDELWEIPQVRTRFRIVTATWGVGLVIEASTRVVLALSLSTQDFLIASQVLGWVVIGGLLWFTIAFSRAGERRIAALIEEGFVSPSDSVPETATPG